MDKIDKINELYQTCANNLMTEDFDYREQDFDFWQDADGTWDDTCEFLDKYLDGKAVIGWCTEDSFEATDKIVPDYVKAIMASKEPETPYKKHSFYVNVWSGLLDGFKCLLLKTPYHTNYGGRDYIEYWYFLALE